MATHTVPEGGLPAWPAPDPSQPSTVSLAARVELTVQEWRGQWAHVVADNGWSGWVDGARLVAVGSVGGAPSAPPTGPPTGPPSGPVAARSTDTIQQKLTPALVGAVLVALGALLPWIRLAGDSKNAFGIGLKFLVDYKTSSGDKFPHVGELLIILAIVLGVAAVMPERAKLGRPAAAVTIAVSVLYVVQIQRFLSALGDGPGKPGLTSLVGFGVFVTLAGAIGTIAFPMMRDRR